MGIEPTPLAWKANILPLYEIYKNYYPEIPILLCSGLLPMIQHYKCPSGQNGHAGNVIVYILKLVTKAATFYSSNLMAKAPLLYFIQFLHVCRNLTFLTNFY